MGSLPSMLKVFAPGRVELLGNHTDYNQGFVLSFAVERGITFSGSLRGDDKIILHGRDLGRTYDGSVSSLAPSQEQPWANYVLGVVQQFVRRGITLPGFEAEIVSTLPMGAGLSSSAALETATALFLQQTLSTSFSPLELAQIGQAAEHEYVGVKCGLLDQISSIFSQQDQVTFIDFRSLAVQTFPLPAEARFIVANSHAKHALVSGEYNERRASCEAAARTLGFDYLRAVSSGLLESRASELTPQALLAARHIVGENERVLAALEALKNGHLEALGAIMFASHQSSQINFRNSCPELDALVEQAKKNSACLGARLSGGGFGGATINLTRVGSETAVIEALNAVSPKVECLLTRAADGARILQS